MRTLCFFILAILVSESLALSGARSSQKSAYVKPRLQPPEIVPWAIGSVGNPSSWPGQCHQATLEDVQSAQFREFYNQGNGLMGLGNFSAYNNCQLQVFAQGASNVLSSFNNTNDITSYNQDGTQNCANNGLTPGNVWMGTWNPQQVILDLNSTFQQTLSVHYSGTSKGDALAILKCGNVPPPSSSTTAPDAQHEVTQVRFYGSTCQQGMSASTFKLGVCHQIFPNLADNVKFLSCDSAGVTYEMYFQSNAQCNGTGTRGTLPVGKCYQDPNGNFLSNFCESVPNEAVKLLSKKGH